MIGDQLVLIYYHDHDYYIFIILTVIIEQLSWRKQIHLSNGKPKRGRFNLIAIVINTFIITVTNTIFKCSQIWILCSRHSNQQLNEHASSSWRKEVHLSIASCSFGQIGQVDWQIEQMNMLDYLISWECYTCPNALKFGYVMVDLLMNNFHEERKFIWSD